MYVHMYTYIHACMHACIHYNTIHYMHIYIHTYIRTYIHTYIHTPTRVCVCVRVLFLYMHAQPYNSHVEPGRPQHRAPGGEASHCWRHCGGDVLRQKLIGCIQSFFMAKLRIGFLIEPNILNQEYS